MWLAFIIGLLSEWFGESKDPGRFVLKGFASGITGMVLNFVLLLLVSNYASSLIGHETPTWTNFNAEFFLIPFVAAFIALIIVKSARYFSNMR